VLDRTLAALARHAGAIAERCARGRIVDGHGDLRPEHVCLESPPQVIDCLEFSRELRIVDPAEELGFLALECERLGAPQLKADLFDAYAAGSGDEPAATLVDFYQSLHACVRATLAVAHLHERDRDDHARWAARAADYLRLAARHIGVETAG
jgi:aminoglycoside phosphotransferase family enzyme